MRLFVRLVFCLACLAVLLCIACSVALSVAGSRERLFSADAAVVFGDAIYGDVSPPRLEACLERALALYRDGFCRTIIVSGAPDKEGAGGAPAMRDYLLARGVPARALVTDSSGSGIAAARFTAAWLVARGGKSAIAVSRYFHLPRARLMLSRMGIGHVGTASADYWEWRDLYAAPREAVAFWRYYLQ